VNTQFERFLYYGQSPLSDEVDFDLKVGLMQGKRTLFYDRGFGVGVDEYENIPSGLALEIGLKYDIASWISARNATVTDGSNGTRDRRAVTSQTVIDVIQLEGNVDIVVKYIMLGSGELRAVATQGGI